MGRIEDKTLDGIDVDGDPYRAYIFTTAADGAVAAITARKGAHITAPQAIELATFLLRAAGVKLSDDVTALLSGMPIADIPTPAPRMTDADLAREAAEYANKRCRLVPSPDDTARVLGMMRDAHVRDRDAIAVEYFTCARAAGR